MLATCVRGGAAAKTAGVSLPSARSIRRWLWKSRHRSIRCRPSASVSKISDDSSSSGSRPLKLSTIPFCHGDSGSLESVPVPLSAHHDDVLAADSATRRYSRAFSFSISLIRRTVSRAPAPYSDRQRCKFTSDTPATAPPLRSACPSPGLRQPGATSPPPPRAGAASCSSASSGDSSLPLGP